MKLFWFPGKTPQLPSLPSQYVVNKIKTITKISNIYITGRHSSEMSSILPFKSDIDGLVSRVCVHAESIMLNLDKVGEIRRKKEEVLFL